MVKANLRRTDIMDINLIAQAQRFAFRTVFAHAIDHSLSNQLVRA